LPDLAELLQIEADFLARHGEYRAIMSALPLANADALDGDTNSSIAAEGAFIRLFTLWENTVEETFIYFCLGGPHPDGNRPTGRLVNCDKAGVRKILTAQQRYLDWSDQRMIRGRAHLFFEDGKPFSDPIIGKAQVLSDAEKLRNVIAHNSPESWNGYSEVQRNNFQTERTFAMTPGQMLRARALKLKINWGEFYLDEIAAVFAAILRPQS
jgi:hypothetical protein